MKIDEKEYCSVYEKYADKTFKQAYRIFDGCIQSSKDVVQIVFMKLWEKAKDDPNYIENPEHLEKWLSTVCRNAALKYISRKYSFKYKPTIINTDTYNVYAAFVNPREAILDKELHDGYEDIYNANKTEVIASDLERLIDTLSKKQKDVVVLKLEGMTNKSIAKQLGVTENLVASRLFYTFKRLREVIARRGRHMFNYAT